MPRSGAPPSTATPWVELALGGRRWSGQLDQAGTEAVALAPLLPELSPRDRVTLRGADLRRDLPSLVNALRRRDLGMRSDGATPASALTTQVAMVPAVEAPSARPIWMKSVLRAMMVEISIASRKKSSTQKSIGTAMNTQASTFRLFRLTPLRSHPMYPASSSAHITTIAARIHGKYTPSRTGMSP